MVVLVAVVLLLCASQAQSRRANDCWVIQRVLCSPNSGNCFGAPCNGQIIGLMIDACALAAPQQPGKTQCVPAGAADCSILLSCVWNNGTCSLDAIDWAPGVASQLAGEPCEGR
jgi:hypothetical protein